MGMIGKIIKGLFSGKRIEGQITNTRQVEVKDERTGKTVKKTEVYIVPTNTNQAPFWTTADEE